LNKVQLIKATIFKSASDSNVYRTLRFISLLLTLIIDYSVMKVAKKFADDGKTVSFAVSNNNEFGQEISEFGLDSPKFDKPVVAARDGAGMKYVMADEFR